MMTPVPKYVKDLDSLVSHLNVILREHGNKSVPSTVLVELYSSLDFEDEIKAEEVREAALRG